MRCCQSVWPNPIANVTNQNSTLQGDAVAEILDLEEKRRQLAAKRGFQHWVHRFSESFDARTCCRDISDATLAKLIQGGEEFSPLLYEFIMGVKGWGPGRSFENLESPAKMAVMDIALFMLDQLRFEALHRLGWIEDFYTLQVPFVEMVEEFTDRFAARQHQTPALSPQHPGFTEYQEAFETDRGRFIRKLIPDMIQAYKDKTQEPA